MNKTRVALYLRVSTTDKGQDVENQRAQLLAFCERQGYEVVREYVDEESGTKGRRERSAFARLFRAMVRTLFVKQVCVRDTPQLELTDFNVS